MTLDFSLQAGYIRDIVQILHDSAGALRGDWEEEDLMTIAVRRLFLALIALACIQLTGCASKGGQTATAEVPVPPEIQPNVDFWRMVYGEWSRSQVAFHDDEHMGVIYEVADLPGPVLSGYTGEQQRFVRYKTAQYRDRLASLERKVVAGRRLSGLERELHDKLVEAGGRSAVYGASERVRAQRGVRERFRRGVEISGRYDDIFRRIFRARGLPEDLAYLPHVESSFQVKARSSVGAAGVWQFMPATARTYDLTVNHAIDERLDPILAAEGAARYLDDAYRRLGSWPLAITSYNHGQGGMMKAKRLYGDDIGRIVRRYKGRAFGFASRNFYAEFVAAREVAGNPKKYFPEGIAYEKPLDHDQLVLGHSMPARHLADHYGLSVYRLSDINLAWRRAVVHRGANIPSGSTVWLPAGTIGRVAGQPRPVPVKVARLAPKPAPAVAEPAPKPTRAAPAAKTHVVKPNETLYRVALRYDISIAELKKLNRMKPGEDTIRAGQRLRVSG
jgi:membrane-bound lytic murein transglycosylase D